MRFNFPASVFILLITPLIIAAANSPDNPSDATRDITNPETQDKTIKSDSSRGQLLYENHCQLCHESKVHIRNNRKASSIAEVKSWVIRWQQERKLNWTQQEVNDVTNYLVQRYYKF